MKKDEYVYLGKANQYATKRVIKSSVLDLSAYDDVVDCMLKKAHDTKLIKDLFEVISQCSFDGYSKYIKAYEEICAKKNKKFPIDKLIHSLTKKVSCIEFDKKLNFLLRKDIYKEHMTAIIKYLSQTYFGSRVKEQFKFFKNALEDVEVYYGRKINEEEYKEIIYNSSMGCANFIVYMSERINDVNIEKVFELLSIKPECVHKETATKLFGILLFRGKLDCVDYENNKFVIDKCSKEEVKKSLSCGYEFFIHDFFKYINDKEECDMLISHFQKSELEKEFKEINSIKKMKI